MAISRGVYLLFSMMLFMIGYLFSRMIRKHSTEATFRLRRRWLEWQALPVLGMKVTLDGQTATEPAIYVCNHRSFSDPIVLCRYIDAYVIAKAEVAKYPLIHQGAALTGIIYVDRDSKDSRSNTREAMVSTVKDGKNILVYPEGTVSDDEGILPYRKGPFYEAATHGLTVVPCVLEYRDAKDRWAHISLIAQYMRQFSARETVAHLHIGPPMRSTDGEALHDQVERYTKEKLKEVRKKLGG